MTTNPVAPSALTTTLTILDVIRDPALFGSVLTGPSWSPWRRCAATVFGITDGLTPGDRRFIRRRLGGCAVPRAQAQEAWLVIGRRGGKSRFAALVAVFLACFRDYQAVLAAGERGILMVIASDRRQARVVHGYVSGLLHAIPLLEALIVHETKETIALDNGITIEIHTASYRALRGHTVVGAICDEVAFWRSEEAANPDTEILNALRPAMATVPGALLLCISSPYARKGELWKAYRTHYGHPERSVVVWQADTLTMNPTIPAAVIERAYAEDEAVAAAEYGAQFRRDLESFLSRDALDAAVAPHRRELPPSGELWYVAFVDPSGGSADSMTLAIAHRQHDRVVLDAVREVRPPFSPAWVVEEFGRLLKDYRVTTVVGDHYGGEWPREQFRRRGIEYALSSRAKSEIYGELLPLLNSGRAELLDHPRLLAQLAGLERRTSRAGRDTIDHAHGAHDDVANAVAGALVELADAREPGDYGLTL